MDTKLRLEALQPRTALSLFRGPARGFDADRRQSCILSS